MKILNLKEKLAEYDNGNYHVTLLRDGTKIRENDLDFFEADFPESIDITISKKCSRGCKYCYMNCIPDGKFADLSNIDKLLDSIHPYTELALNCNDINEPKLIDFILKARQIRIIVNLTVNQNHFLENYGKFMNMLTFGDVHGLGISLTKVTDELLSKLIHQNMILHTIAGIIGQEDLNKLSNKNLKILILGYKNKGRGVEYNETHDRIINTRINFLKNNIRNYLDKFNVISFDNLALEQLNIKAWMKNWDEFYMGDDGKFTFYIDLVDKKFYKSSLETQGFEMLDNVTDMFKIVKEL